MANSDEDFNYWLNGLRSYKEIRELRNTGGMDKKNQELLKSINFENIKLIEERRLLKKQIMLLTQKVDELNKQYQLTSINLDVDEEDLKKMYQSSQNQLRDAFIKIKNLETAIRIKDQQLINASRLKSSFEELQSEMMEKNKKIENLEYESSSPQQSITNQQLKEEFIHLQKKYEIKNNKLKKTKESLKKIEEEASVKIRILEKDLKKSREKLEMVQKGETSIQEVQSNEKVITPPPWQLEKLVQSIAPGVFSGVEIASFNSSELSTQEDTQKLEKLEMQQVDEDQECDPFSDNVDFVGDEENTKEENNNERENLNRSGSVPISSKFREETLIKMKNEQVFLLKALKEKQEILKILEMRNDTSKKINEENEGKIKEKDDQIVVWKTKYNNFLEKYEIQKKKWKEKKQKMSTELKKFENFKPNNNKKQNGEWDEKHISAKYNEIIKELSHKENKQNNNDSSQPSFSKEDVKGPNIFSVSFDNIILTNNHFDKENNDSGGEKSQSLDLKKESPIPTNKLPENPLQKQEKKEEQEKLENTSVNQNTITTSENISIEGNKESQKNPFLEYSLDVSNLSQKNLFVFSSSFDNSPNSVSESPLNELTVNNHTVGSPNGESSYATQLEKIKAQHKMLNKELRKEIIYRQALERQINEMKNRHKIKLQLCAQETKMQFEKDLEELKKRLEKKNEDLKILEESVKQKNEKLALQEKSLSQKPNFDFMKLRDENNESLLKKLKMLEEELMDKESQLKQLSLNHSQLKEDNNIKQEQLSVLKQISFSLQKEIKSKNEHIQEQDLKIKKNRLQSTNFENIMNNSEQENIVRLKEEIHAHISQNEILSKENIRLQQESTILLKSKTETIDDLSNQLEELRSAYQNLRQKLIFTTKTEISQHVFEELESIKLDYFFSLALTVKLEYSLKGVSCNFDIQDLYSRAKFIDRKNWRSWIVKNAANDIQKKKK